MIKVCGFRISNYHNKVLIALLEKGISYEEDSNVRPSQKDDYVARSPMGKVPYLEVDGTRLIESEVILEYLEEAYRLGLVQEVLPAADVLGRARELATSIASAAPLGVQAMLASARNAIESGVEPEAAFMPKRALPIFASEDVVEGVRSLVEKRDGVFKGR